MQLLGVLSHLCIDSYFLSQSFLAPGLLGFSLRPSLPLLHIAVKSYNTVRMDVSVASPKHPSDVKVKSQTLFAMQQYKLLLLLHFELAAVLCQLEQWVPYLFHCRML